MKLVYFSLTGNSEIFASKIDKSLIGNPIELTRENCGDILMDDEFLVLFGSYNVKHAVYNHISKFLNTGINLELCKGIVGTGNRNLNKEFLSTPKEISKDFGLDIVLGLELHGMGKEHEILNKKLESMINETIINNKLEMA